MGKILGGIAGILLIAITLIRFMPIPLETRIEWIT